MATARKALRMSLRQMQIAVVYCAVLLGFATLLLRVRRDDLVPVLVFESIAAPMVLALVTKILVRRGPMKERTVTLLLAYSIGAFLVFINRLFPSRDGELMPWQVPLADVFLGTSFVVLLWRALRPRPSRTGYLRD